MNTTLYRLAGFLSITWLIGFFVFGFFNLVIFVFTAFVLLIAIVDWNRKLDNTKY